MTISPINLGSTFTNTSGSSVLSGISSGLNTQAVINSLVASQSSQVTTLQDQVTVNNSQVTALSSLQQILTQLQTAAAQLSTPQSPDPTNNAFAASTVQITSNTTQAASNFLTATANADTPAGSYTISNISQLATATTQQTSAFTVSPSTTAIVVASGAVSGQFNAGTFTIAGPSGSANVTFNTGDSLNQVAADFNAVSSTTGLTASVKTSSTGVYTLAFTNTTTGAAVTFDLTSASNITSDTSGVFSAQDSSTYTLSAATNPVVVASGAASGQFNAGSFTLTGPDGSATVTLNAGDTLSDVEADFNAKESTTGIEASLLQTSPGSYTLVFSSTTTGADTVFDLTNTAKAGTVTNDTNGALSQISFQTMTAANEGQDASFELNGTAITRPTNTVSDLISGVTINLLQNTSTQAGASFTLQVSPDTSGIQTAVDNFVNTYNNFLVFYAQQTALNSSGTPASSAVLYSDDTLRSVYNQLTGEAASIVSGLAKGSGNQLSDIGLSFTNTPATSSLPAVANALTVDNTTLDSYIQSNLSTVENVFGYNLTSSSSNLASFQNATNSSVSSFTVNIDQTGSPPSYTATYTDSTGAQQTVNFTASSLGSSGIALTAPSDSALAGLVLIYTGTGNESNISVSVTNGIAAQVNNFLTSALTANTGLLAVDESGIQTKTTSLQTQITNVNTQVANTRAELLQQYSALEAAISEANSSLDLLNAQQQAASSGG
jgi:flagellar hook-associated protein 2